MEDFPSVYIHGSSRMLGCLLLQISISLKFKLMSM